MADATNSASDQPSNSAASAVPASSVTVNIKTLNGPDFELGVELDVLVSDLKTKVRERTDIDESRQRLIYRGKVLADTEPLSTYKIEDGHFVHMVARPQGVPPPLTSATTGTAPGDGHVLQAAPGVVGGARPVLRAANGARGERTLGERLLMGMGLPPFAQGEGGGGLQQGGRVAGIAPGGVHGANTEADNVPMEAAVGLGGGDFLSNMLGLGADNAHPQRGARPAWTEGRGARGQRREVGPGLGSSGLPATRADGLTDLEHVRQGLLTLHTLLSGSTTRRETAQEGSADGATGTARAKESSNGTEIVSGKCSALDTPPESADAAKDHHQNSSMVTVAEGGTLRAEARTPRAEAGAGSAEKQAADPDMEHKSNGALAASDGDRCAGKNVSYSGKTNLPPASFDDGTGDEGGRSVEDAEEGCMRVRDQETGGVEAPSLSPLSESGAPSRHWPFLGQRPNALASSSEASEGPPRLLSSSGESSPDVGTSHGWERRDQDREAHAGRPLFPFPQRFERDYNGRGDGDNNDDNEEDDTDADDDDEGEEEEHEEEKEEDCLGREGESRSRRVARKFFVGQWLDVKDTVNNWLEATIMDIVDSGTRLQIHYNGWPPRWDEWLSWDSPRIAPFRTRTQHLPHSQHVSPAPISAVRNAPITGMDDVRVVMPEVSRVLQEISPMVSELSTSYARNLEQDPSNSPAGDRAVSHTLPWTRQRFQRQGLEEQNVDPSASVAIAPGARAAAELAGEIAPLLDRLGRMLTDVAPHLARLSAQVEVDRAEMLASEGGGAEQENAAVQPSEVPREADRHRFGVQRIGARRSRESERRRGAAGRANPDPAEDTSVAFRQLVSTSSPPPTSSNINIHIHAIVPLRAPPSPPPPPPPTASASTEATPTRADRPPLAVAGGRNSPWGGGSMDTMGESASIVAAARAAAASRAAAVAVVTARDSSDTVVEAITPRRLNGGIVAESIRSGGERDATGAVTGIAANGVAFDRSSSLGSSVSFDVSGVSASPLAVSTPGSSAAVHSEPAPTPSSLSSAGVAAAISNSDAVPADQAGNAALAGPNGGGGQRRGGGWRGLFRVLGVGNGNNTRVSGRRDGVDGDQNV